MTTESMCTTLKERQAFHKIILRLNAHLNNQLCSEKLGGHYALVVTMFCSLHSITNEEQYK